MFLFYFFLHEHPDSYTHHISFRHRRPLPRLLHQPSPPPPTSQVYNSVQYLENVRFQNNFASLFPPTLPSPPLHARTLTLVLVVFLLDIDTIDGSSNVCSISLRCRIVECSLRRTAVAPQCRQRVKFFVTCVVKSYSVFLCERCRGGRCAAWAGLCIEIWY